MLTKNHVERKSARHILLVSNKDNVPCQQKKKSNVKAEPPRPQPQSSDLAEIASSCIRIQKMILRPNFFLSHHDVTVYFLHDSCKFAPVTGTMRKLLCCHTISKHIFLSTPAKVII